MPDPITLQPTIIPVTNQPPAITLQPTMIPVGNAPPVAPNLAPPAGPLQTDLGAQQQVAQAGQQLSEDVASMSPYAGGTPDGSIRSTPEQATADTLNNLDQQEQLEGEQGKDESKEAKAEAAKQMEAAQEKIQQANDFATLQSANQAKYEDAHAQTQAAYQDYRKAAGSLKDPNSQFWEDHGQGSRITAALAAFSSGMGAGLTGHGGNPFMDFLTKQIDNNFQAHKQNIDDLYNSAVAAGKIEDSAESHNRFMNEAKLKSYDLASAHISHELNAIKDTTTSQVAKVTAAKAIAGLEQQGIQARQALAQKEAARGAAALAAQRAAQREVRETFQKNLELHNKDMGEDEARLAAVKDLVASGYDRSAVAAIADANGVQYDTKSGQWAIPKPAEQPSDQASEPHYDEDGKLVVPTKTASGKRIPQEERDKQKKDIEERTTNIDGKPAIFRTKEAAEAYAAVPEAKRLLKQMQTAWSAGDKGTYDQARLQFIESAPKLLGFKRGPSGAQAGEGGGHDPDGDNKATIAGQLPEFEPSLLGKYSQTIAAINNNYPLPGNTPVAVANHKLAAVGSYLDSIDKDARANLVTPQRPAPSPADLAKKFGGKVVQ